MLRCFEFLVSSDEVLDTLMTIEKSAKIIADSFHPVHVEVTYAFCEIISGFLFAKAEGHNIIMDTLSKIK